MQCKQKFNISSHSLYISISLQTTFRIVVRSVLTFSLTYTMLLFSAFSLLSSTSLASAIYTAAVPPQPEGLTTVASPSDASVSISYKQVPPSSLSLALSHSCRQLSARPHLASSPTAAMSIFHPMPTKLDLTTPTSSSGSSKPDRTLRMPRSPYGFKAGLAYLLLQLQSVRMGLA